MSLSKLTILCDLDDTLLKNDFNTFLPAYLKAFGKTVNASTLLPDNVFIPNLLSGTEKMIANQSPTHTLQDVFDEAFFPAIKQNKSTFEPTIHQFYDEVFQTLRSLTAPFAESKNIIEYTLKNHPHTVIATNPLFPITATAQRLEWAGIPINNYSYSLVTTYESFHFSKPHVSYYAEILGQLGWPDNLAVMIGNDLEEDIRPASILGLPTYWITTTLEKPEFNRHPLSTQGGLSGVVPWLENLSKATNGSSPLPAKSLPAVLRSTPAVIDTFINRNSTNGTNKQTFKDPTVARFIFELAQHELDHLADLQAFQTKSGVNSSYETSLQAIDQEAGNLQIFFDQRKNLLAKITKILSTPASSDNQDFLAFLKTVSQTDQDLIRRIKKILQN